MIDLSQVRVLNSPAAVLAFRRTARLESFGCVPGTMTIRSTGTESWPALVIEQGGAPVQSATLWVFLQINGIWYAAGAERLRPNQTNGTKPEAQPQYGGLDTLIGDGWFGKHDAPIRGWRPALDGSSKVGVMLVAGDTRLGNQTPVQERSDVIVVEWRAGNPMREVWREGIPVPPADPVPMPPADPVAPTQDTRYDDLLRRIEALEQRPAPAPQTKVPTRTKPLSVRLGGFVPVTIPSLELE